jgi:hypothetical protein
MRWRIAMVFAAALCVAGCSEREQRELPFPTFEARAPFPELSGRSAGSKGGESGASAQSDFERAISESREEADSDEQAADASTIKWQEVPLAGGLVSSIPLEFEQWEWSSQGRVTMVTYRDAGDERPQALIYVEEFSPIIRSLPSAEMRRFQQTADPRLVPELSLPGMAGGAMQQLSQETGVDMGRLGDAIGRATSHTMGLGLNYASSEDTFSGWRWVGHNPHDVEIRLARTSGHWLARPLVDPSVSGTFAEITERVSGLGEVQRRYDEAVVDGRVGSTSGWPAWMLIGSAVTGRDSGAHVAIICKASPDCPVAAELSEFLARMRPAGPGTLDTLRSQSSQPQLDDFADELGLPFVPTDDLLPPGEIGAELRRALSQ